jgi:hypothetical protein
MNIMDTQVPGITEERLQQLTDEAEQGYPLVGSPDESGPGMVLAELTPEVRSAVIARADATQRSATDVIDEAVRQYLHVS